MRTFILAFAFAVGAAHLCHADPTAAALNQQGIKAAQAKDWELARQRFTESYALDPRPTTLYNLANAQERTDHLLAARDSYTKYLAATHPGDHDDFRRRATKALVALDEAIPTLRIAVASLPATGVVSLDGEDVTAKLDAPIPLDPGEHAVEVRDGSDVVAHRAVSLVRGAREHVELTGRRVDDTALARPEEPPPPPTGAAVAIATKIPAPAAVTSSSHHSIFASGWFWGATTIVVLGLAAGGYYHFVYDSPDTTHGTLGHGVYGVP
ncbi:MAG TPA: hypothetical protein VMJ10_15075 [Kofleriaceae bacterium]|nr:hypothetical protein [Kofleriaceae bacterium]